MYNGTTGEKFMADIFIGIVYYQKLHHMVADNDCLIGHGAAMLLRDRLLEESDKYIIYVCEKCGFLGYYDMKQRRYMCSFCGDKGKITPIMVSYAFKLLLQELMSLCVAPRLILKERA